MDFKDWPIGLNDNPINRKALDDIRALGSRGDESLLEKIIDLFKSRSKSLLEEITQSLDNKDTESLWKTAHALKSSSGNVGAMNVFEICSVIEIRARDGKLERLEELIELLKQELDVACKELHAYLEETQE
ncbi:MAG: Hpt domain-containing protein [Pseudomonadales bacterium]|nr:Hpt domain-containing protein [Pseudomonadales bacterium]